MSKPFRILARIRGASLFGPLAVRSYKRLEPGQPLIMLRESSNPVDPSAVQLLDMLGQPVGYIARQQSGAVAARLDRGESLLAKVFSPRVRQEVAGKPWRAAIAVVWSDGSGVSDQSGASDQLGRVLETTI